MEMTFCKSWVEREEKSKSLRRVAAWRESAGEDGSYVEDVADTGEGTEDAGVEGNSEDTDVERKLTHSDRSNMPVFSHVAEVSMVCTSTKVEESWTEFGVEGTDGEVCELTDREGIVFCWNKVESNVLISVKLDTNGSSSGFNIDSVALHTSSELSRHGFAHTTGWGKMVSVPVQK